MNFPRFRSGHHLTNRSDDLKPADGRRKAWQIDPGQPRCVTEVGEGTALSKPPNVAPALSILHLRQQQSQAVPVVLWGSGLFAQSLGDNNQFPAATVGDAIGAVGTLFIRSL